MHMPVYKHQIAAVIMVCIQMAYLELLIYIQMRKSDVISIYILHIK